MNKIKVLLIIIIALFSRNLTAQECKISEKLIMNYYSKKIDLPEKIYAFLKYKNRKDSILLTKNFEFEFNNLPKDTFNLSFSIRHYPTNTYCILHPK
jgi:nitrogen fixation protein